MAGPVQFGSQQYLMRALSIQGALARSIGKWVYRGPLVNTLIHGNLTLSHVVLERGILPVVKLRVRAGESIQEAVRRFRKLCERSGLRKEMRRKAYYEKPSERRRREELKRLRKARQHQVSRV